MNVVIAIMLVFAGIGIIDRITGNRLKLGEEFDKGLSMMGAMAMAMTGVYCVGITAVEACSDKIAALSSILPFDPSVIIGAVISPDMGGLPICLQMAESRSVGLFSGMLMASTLGAAISFQFPVCLAGIRDKNDVRILMDGFIIGTATILPGLIIGGLILGMPVKVLCTNLIPMAVICVILIVCFKCSPKKTSAVMMGFGNIISVLSIILFAVVLAGVFVPAWSFTDISLVYEVILAVVKMTVVIGGSLVFSKLALRYFGRFFAVTAGVMKTNEYAVIGLILGMTSTLAMIPVFGKMDRRGKIINGAFSISGAYIIGGQMGFVSGFAEGRELISYFAAKLIAGGCAVAAALLVKPDKDTE